ncbi:PucR family transcriptional regulator [Nocardia xishanensis]|uniref:PucR family transcriptional regulator n=1 Tax=Nocardia xishanensis TaxID=238964 RepID=A0ABW7XBR7_9NOCA
MKILEAYAPAGSYGAAADLVGHVPTPADQAAISLAVQQVASDLADHVGDLARECAAVCARGVPALGDKDLLPTLLASCEASVRDMLSMLQRGVPGESAPTPPSSQALAHELVHLGADVKDILQGYRIGQAWFQEVFARGIAERVNQPPEMLATLLPFTHWLFAYVNSVCERLAREFDEERRRWLPTAAALRQAVICGLLDGTEDDLEAASITLAYDLRRTHVALVAWRDTHVDGESEDDFAALIRRAIAPVLRGGRPLVHAISATAGWAWLPLAQPPTLRLPAGSNLRIAIGSAHSGLDGFRRTHTEALQARRVAELGGEAATRVTQFRTVELAALLLADVDAARNFVRDELGPLAEHTESAARLRETLLALCQHGSLSAAAQQLGVHHNTVIYRTKKAEELLGRPITPERLRLHAALYLVDVLGLDDITRRP